MAAKVKRNSVEVMYQNLTIDNRKMWDLYSESLSESTRKVYQSDILNIMLWLRKDIRKVTVKDFEKLIKELHEKEYSVRTINRKIYVVRGMLNYLVEKDKLDMNPLKSISELDTSEQVVVKNVLSWQQVQQCKDLGGMKYDIFETAYLLGLSNEECAEKLNLSHYQLYYRVKQLGEELGIENFKYTDMVETRKQNFVKCPSCGEMHEAIQDNWKFENGLLVCVDCTSQEENKIKIMFDKQCA